MAQWNTIAGRRHGSKRVDALPVSYEMILGDKGVSILFVDAHADFVTPDSYVDVRWMFSRRACSPYARDFAKPRASTRAKQRLHLDVVSIPRLSFPQREAWCPRSFNPRRVAYRAGEKELRM